MRPFNATQDVNTCNSANRLFSDSLRSSDVMRAGDGRKEEAGASGQCVSGLEPWNEFRGLFAEEAIADAADGFDEVGGVAQFLAEGSHVDIDRTFQRIGIFSA